MWTTERKLAVGAALACVGGAALILVLLIDPELERPWSFLIGFGTGLCSALGAGLCLVGLTERRRNRRTG